MPAKQFNRIYFGETSPAGMARIMAAIRAEYRQDDLTWYVIEEASVGVNDHPRSPGHHWIEIEADDEELNTDD